MDINDWRALATVLAFVVFVGIVLWAYSGKRKRAFDEAARAPIDDDDRRPYPRATKPTDSRSRNEQ